MEVLALNQPDDEMVPYLIFFSLLESKGWRRRAYQDMVLLTLLQTFDAMQPRDIPQHMLTSVLRTINGELSTS